jgi:hypothetical protein
MRPRQRARSAQSGVIAYGRLHAGIGARRGRGRPSFHLNLKPFFALNGLKLAADWKTGPLLEQVRLQDDAFAAVRRLAERMGHPPLPVTPRLTGGTVDSATVERLRDEGDRMLGELLLWATGEDARAADRGTASEIEHMLRRLICDQLKVELATTPKSMLQQIAGGERAPGTS